MAGESGRLGLLQGTRAAGEQEAGEGIIREPAPSPASAGEGEAGREAARPRAPARRACPLLTYT